MAVKFDISVLCSLVEARSCLWDKRDDNYRNKVIRERSWEEVFKFLDDEYEAKTAAEKKQTGEKIMSKWVNIRDAFIRSLKSKSGQAAKKNYIYHEHLLFLLAAQEPSETESSNLFESQQQQHMDVSEEENSANIEDSEDRVGANEDLPTRPSDRVSRKRQYRNELNVIEKEIMEELKKPRIEEPRCSFFTSFEAYVVDMTEAEKLELHMSILKSISDIKARRSQPVYLYQD